MRLKDQPGVKAGNLLHVPVSMLSIEEGYNERSAVAFHGDSFETLKRDIAENGVMTPLTVRAEGDKVLIVSGHRRHAACVALGDAAPATVPCVMEPRGRTPLERKLALISDNSGMPLEPLAVMRVVFMAASEGMDVSDIAKKTGFTPQYVRDMLLLNTAPESIHAMIDAGNLSPTLAYETMRQHGAAGAAKLLADAADVAASSGKSRVTAKSVAAALDNATARRAAAAGNAAPASAPASAPVIDAAASVTLANAAADASAAIAAANANAKPDAAPLPLASASKPVAKPRARAVFSANKRSLFCGTTRIAIAETVTDAIILARILNAAQPAEYIPPDDSNVVALVKPDAAKPVAAKPDATKANINVAF